ncbi:GAF and ANTAR domain-containing protein [Aquipuribacter sp. MA13-6]|uniref:GAF and ANTAR domain-containing protein n=1 Tax=unclassified Aquipuribacter TaxID=2635084 RepID=UPI003EEAFB68
MPSSRVAKILDDLTGSGQGSGADLPQRLVDACAAALPVSGVGMVLMTDAGPVGVVAASDGPATVMEDLQFTLGVGPCVDASGSGRPVLVADLAHVGPQRWPPFAAGALEAGIRAIFAYPLRVGAIRLGVLDLYRDTSGPLGEAEHRVALDYADAATAVLLHLQSRTPVPGSDDGDGDEVLVDVVNQRAEVHQASGMVAVQRDVGLPEALVLLRARAYATGRPVLDLARDVVARRVSFAGDDDDGDLANSPDHRDPS